MASFRLTLEYDGTGFEGWQAQAGGHRTVQGALEEAVRAVTGRAVRPVGAGRTDAGVHAEGQVTGLALDTRLDAPTLQRALNAHLPADLAVRALAPAEEGFHARRDALGKLYRYAVWNGPVRSPLRARRSLHVPRALDVAAMRRAAGALEGRHDFASFRAAGSAVDTTVRTLRRLAVRGEPGGDLLVEAEGPGFLRHMVRNLVGTLLEVGRGRRDPEGMTALLAARDRSRAGPTAAAHGLTLVWVDYGKARAAGDLERGGVDAPGALG